MNGKEAIESFENGSLSFDSLYLYLITDCKHYNMPYRKEECYICIYKKYCAQFKGFHGNVFNTYKRRTL